MVAQITSAVAIAMSGMLIIYAAFLGMNEQNNCPWNCVPAAIVNNRLPRLLSGILRWLEPTSP